MVHVPVHRNVVIRELVCCKAVVTVQNRVVSRRIQSQAKAKSRASLGGVGSWSGLVREMHELVGEGLDRRLVKLWDETSVEV